jgi:hypothetical protein
MNASDSARDIVGGHPHAEGVLAWIVLIAMLLLAREVAAQFDPDRIARSLLLFPHQRAWVLTAGVPDAYRFCAARDAGGQLRGCITAKELRERLNVRAAN